MGEAPEMQSAKHISSLIQDVAHLDGKALSILDVGCAAGHYLRSIIQRLPDTDIEYFGVDIDPNMVGTAQEVWKGFDRAKFFCGSGDELQDLEVPACDVVFSANAFMYFPNVRTALTSFFGKTKQIMMARRSFCEQTYIIQRAQPSEWHPLSRVPEAEIIDEDGMLRSYDHWNIYSRGLMEHLVRENCPEARISWHDDRFNDDFVVEEEVANIGEKREGTVLFGNHQVVYPIIQPWKTLVVERKKMHGFPVERNR